MSNDVMTTKVMEDVQAEAARLLDSGEVSVVIGYTRAPHTEVSVPFFARTAVAAAKLVFDDQCFANLTVYLAKPEVRALGRIGIVVKGCDLKAVNVLIREHVIKREDVYLIGVACPGVGDPLLGKCMTCAVQCPADCDFVAGKSNFKPRDISESTDSRFDEIEKMSLEERWAFWSAQFEKCIRCYACRQVCPLCYCKQCIVEKNKPQWIETSQHLRGNLAWNAIRAFHLTGRCIECGECERVCPENIPLGLINKKMVGLVKEWFDFESGASPEVRAPFTVWSPDDKDHGIL